MNNSRVPIAWKIHCVYRRVRRWVTQWGAFTKAWAPCWVARSRCIPPATKGNIPLYFEKFVIFFSSSESNQGLLVDNGAKRPIRRLSFLIHWKAHTKTRVKIFPNKKFLKKWERVGKTNQELQKAIAFQKRSSQGRGVRIGFGCTVEDYMNILDFGKTVDNKAQRERWMGLIIMILIICGFIKRHSKIHYLMVLRH